MEGDKRKETSKSESEDDNTSSDSTEKGVATPKKERYVLSQTSGGLRKDAIHPGLEEEDLKEKPKHKEGFLPPIPHGQDITTKYCPEHGVQSKLGKRKRCEEVDDNDIVCNEPLLHTCRYCDKMISSLNDGFDHIAIHEGRFTKSQHEKRAILKLDGSDSSFETGKDNKRKRKVRRSVAPAKKAKIATTSTEPTPTTTQDQAPEAQDQSQATTQSPTRTTKQAWITPLLGAEGIRKRRTPRRADAVAGAAPKPPKVIDLTDDIPRIIQSTVMGVTQAVLQSFGFGAGGMPQYINPSLSPSPTQAPTTSQAPTNALTTTQAPALPLMTTPPIVPTWAMTPLTTTTNAKEVEDMKRDMRTMEDKIGRVEQLMLSMMKMMEDKDKDKDKDKNKDKDKDKEPRT